MSENPRPWYADTVEDYAVFGFFIIIAIVCAFTDGHCSLRVVSTPATQPSPEASPK